MSAVIAETVDAGLRLRIAQPQMLTEIMRYSREAFEQSSYAQHGFNSAQWRMVLRGAMLDSSMRVFSMWRGQRCVGLLVGSIGPMPWCAGFAATDLVFVAAQGGDQLLKAFVEWAKQRGCRRIDMAVSDDAFTQYENPEARARAYDRMFAAAEMKRAGGAYYWQGEKQCPA